MKKNLLIIGASGHGKVCVDIAIKMNTWEIIELLDDDDSIETMLGLSVIGKSSEYKEYIDDYDFFIAIGNNNMREQIYENICKVGGTIINLIHPKSIIAKDVIMHRGIVLMAGVVINSSTIIGDGTIVNTGATIDHDNKIGKFVHISPGVNTGGTVNVGNRTWLGIGSKVINNVDIVNDCIIGASSLVINNISVSGTYTGVPVKKADKD